MSEDSPGWAGVEGARAKPAPEEERPEQSQEEGRNSAGALGLAVVRALTPSMVRRASGQDVGELAVLGGVLVGERVQQPLPSGGEVGETTHSCARTGCGPGALFREALVPPRGWACGWRPQIKCVAGVDRAR